jgi:hypothetical protein
MVEQDVLELHFWLGTLGCISFMLFVPESPRWLLLRKRNKEAIKVFNYIAWFNRSPMRVPDDAIFDVVGQVIEENLTLNNTAIGKRRQQMNQTINAVGTQDTSIFSEVRQLYCDKRYASTHLKTKVVYICVLNIYYMALFNYATIQGDIFTIGILFGFAEFIGIVIGEPAMKYAPDWLGLIVDTILIGACSVILKEPGISQTTIYTVFLAQIVFIGIAFNSAFIIMEARTNPKHLAVAFELNMCIGNGTTMIAPLLAKMPEPVPTMMYLIFSTTIIFMLFLIGPRKKEEINIQQTIMSMVEGEG